MANIQNYLNQIKTAVFGKDVRESIHDAIKQCYDDATVNHDNANMEVKLARGTHNTLNDRLEANEEKQENFSEQLEHMTQQILYISALELNCDGENDDSEKLNNFFNNLKIAPLSNRNVKVIFNIDKLLLKNPIFIDRSNIELEGCNCRIIWKGTRNLGNSSKRLYGIFNFITNEVNPIKITKHYKASGIGDDIYAVLTVPNHRFRVGDYCYVKIGDNKYLGGDEDDLAPRFERLCNVIDIAGDDVKIDYNCPWDDIPYGTITDITNMNIYECEPFKNISIYDFELDDQIIINNPTYDSLTGECNNLNSNNVLYRDTSVNFFSFFCTENVTVKNIKGTNFKFPLLRFSKSKNIFIENLNAIKPNIVGSGEGYGIQFTQCKDIRVSRCTGISVRHLVDFSNSSNAIVDMCSANTKLYAISCHGAYEHDITINNCFGTIQTGQSGAEFGNASMNIFINNHKGRISTRYCKNLKVRDSEITMYGFGNDSYFDNCNIINEGAIEIRAISKRNKECSISLLNCNIKRTKNDNSVVNMVSGYKRVVFKQGKIDLISTNVSDENSTSTSLRLQSNDNVFFDSVIIKANIIPYGYKSNIVEIKNCIFECYPYSDVFPIRTSNIKSGDIMIILNYNTFNVYKTGIIIDPYSRLNFENGNTFVNVNNNRFIDMGGIGTIGYNRELSAGEKFTTQIWDNNLIPSNFIFNKKSYMIGNNIIV